MVLMVVFGYSPWIINDFNPAINKQRETLVCTLVTWSRKITYDGRYRLLKDGRDLAGRGKLTTITGSDDQWSKGIQSSGPYLNTRLVV